MTAAILEIVVPIFLAISNGEGPKEISHWIICYKLLQATRCFKVKDKYKVLKIKKSS